MTEYTYVVSKVNIRFQIRKLYSVPIQVFKQPNERSTSVPSPKLSPLPLPSATCCSGISTEYLPDVASTMWRAYVLLSTLQTCFDKLVMPAGDFSTCAGNKCINMLWRTLPILRPHKIGLTIHLILNLFFF